MSSCRDVALFAGFCPAGLVWSRPADLTHTVSPLWLSPLYHVKSVSLSQACLCWCRMPVVASVVPSFWLFVVSTVPLLEAIVESMLLALIGFSDEPPYFFAYVDALRAGAAAGSNGLTGVDAVIGLYALQTLSRLAITGIVDES